MSELCGCCEPDAPLTPVRVGNRPGLSAVMYRIGTFASFRESMLEALARSGLSGISTRRSDDYAITLLELWAAVADVLTFYQERYANEAFLRTATQPSSVRRLAELIDYRPAPGAAAIARVAFTLDEGAAVEVPAGVRVQSVPKAGEQPQTFATLEPLAADARLNSLRVFPEPEPVNPLAAGAREATLDRTDGPSIGAALKPRDAVLVFVNGATIPVETKHVKDVRVEDDRVVVEWLEPVERTWPDNAAVVPLGRTFRLFGHDAPATFMSAAAVGDPTRVAWSLQTLEDAAFSYPGGPQERRTERASRLCLDRRYDGLRVGQRLLVVGADGRSTRVRVIAVEEAQDTFAGRTETVTRVSVTPRLGVLGDRREVVVHELLDPALTFWRGSYAHELRADDVYLPGLRVVDERGAAVEVARTIERGEFRTGVVLRPTDVDVGRTVVVGDGSGRRVLARVRAVPRITQPDSHGFCHLVIPLDAEEDAALTTASATLFGNVALASHGETVRREVVGDGDASAAFQRFALGKQPLTYLASAATDGLASSLRLLVGGVRWTEVRSLYGQEPTARVFTTRRQDDGTTVLQFGDGATGAQLPTGRGNLAATYRVGVGLAGRVRAGSLTTLVDRLAGLSDVTNPTSAQGGADPERLEDARTNAPRSVRTFGRAVSLRDFEDLATASGEVAKARAVSVWDGYDRAIHLTVAAQGGPLFDDEALGRLATMLTAARDPNHRLRLDNYRPVPITVRAAIGVDSAYVRSDVEAAARAALVDALAFDSIRLGEPVHLSDVYRVVQDVDGVAFVDVDLLMFKRPASTDDALFAEFLDRHAVLRRGDGSADPVQPHLRLLDARPDPAQPGVVFPAELATIDAPSEDVSVTASGGLEA